jgi:hypothetical protein
VLHLRRVVIIIRKDVLKANAGKNAVQDQPLPKAEIQEIALNTSRKY